MAFLRIINWMEATSLRQHCEHTVVEPLRVATFMRSSEPTQPGWMRTPQQAQQKTGWSCFGWMGLWQKAHTEEATKLEVL